MKILKHVPVPTRRTFIAAGAALGLAPLLPALSGCGGPAGKGGSGKLRVAATTTMVGDLVRRVGGDRVDLRVVMGAGVDPHTFKPAPGDIAELGAADLVFYNGLHLEGKMVDLFEGKLAEKSLAVAGGIPEERLLSWQEGAGGAHDPHVWFDVELWALAAAAVRDRLVKVDSAGAGAYGQRAEELLAAFRSLHEEVKSKIASVPEGRRVLITSHDAYSYFGKAYGIEVKGLQGISTETEAGLQAINAAVDFIIERKIPAIFVETSVSPKTIERVQADCRQRGVEVAIGGELYSDAMGKSGERPGYAVETYEGMVRYNVDTIVNALK